jgi:hypothetical protein
MINLLPHIQKEKLQEEKEKRILVHWLVLILFFGLSLSLSLLTIKIFISEKLKRERFNLESQEKILDVKTQKEILETNKLISELLKFEKEKKDLSGIIAKVYRTVPTEIQLNNLSILKVSGDEKKNKERLQITLSGFSAERGNLLRLKSILEEQFDEVSFPAQTWVKEKDIDFSVTFLTKE